MSARDMTRSFQSCRNLEEIIFPSTGVTPLILVQTFSGCSSLRRLNINVFNTSNVYHMEGLFKDCTSLTVLDLTSFNTSSLTNTSEMFNNTGLKTIYVSPLL